MCLCLVEAENGQRRQCMVRTVLTTLSNIALQQTMSIESFNTDETKRYVFLYISDEVELRERPGSSSKLVSQ